MRRFRTLLPVAVLAVAVAGCETDKLLTVDPTTVVPAAGAISDVVSARAAVAGLSDALQSGSYYGESFVSFVELSSDNALHSGTFSTYSTADNYQITAENTTVGGIWTAIYRSIGRANAVIEAVTDPGFVLSEEEQGQMLAEAYFIRALGHHNLVKLWSDVPLITTTVSDPAEAATVTRASSAAVYTQILADLAAAEANVNEEPPFTQVTLGAIEALRARVMLYQGNYAGALAEANKVIAHGYALAPNYTDLFDERGNGTTEDIFRVRFNDQDAGSVSYYYMPRGLGGRREVSTTSNARGMYETADARRVWNIARTSGGTNYIGKFRSVVGTEHIHVIRLGEVLLIKAEAQARLGDLSGAIATVNMLRARANATPRVLGLLTQQQVIDLVVLERRLELAFEGDRWPDLIRLGMSTAMANASCTALVGAPCPEQGLYPIPQTERDVAPGLTQNPGYGT